MTPTPQCYTRNSNARLAEIARRVEFADPDWREHIVCAAEVGNRTRAGGLPDPTIDSRHRSPHKARRPVDLAKLSDVRRQRYLETLGERVEEERA